ncbi:MAG: ABC transporter substrate-binding protein [Synergistaceae bacterium]|nr:ABC transporter substrate-binding protein [Synergistaceae bacterium]
MASRIALFFIFLFFSCSQNAEAGAMRIVSLYPGHTDNIIALGAANKLIGISRNDDKTTLPKLPRFSAKSGAEEILALKPDLVLTRSLAERQNPHLRSILERAGVKVVSLDPPGWNEFASYLEKLAVLTGSDPKAAAAKLYRIRSKIAADAAEKSKGRHPLVFVEATSKELNTCSPDSWAARLISLAGGRNAAYDAKAVRQGSAIAPYGLERILKAAASGKIEIYLIQHGTMNAADPESLEARPWYPAIKKAKIAAVPEKELSRPSLLGLEAGGRHLVNIFFGE